MNPISTTIMLLIILGMARPILSEENIKEGV
jgi:hypothetical protein